MRKLLTLSIAALFGAQVYSQLLPSPTFHYERQIDGYLNGDYYCGLYLGLFESCYAPAFYDWDGDGLKDLFFGTIEGYIKYYKNTGTQQYPCFTLITSNFGEIEVPLGYAAPFPCDMNGDSIIDFLVGNGKDGGAGGCIHYFIGTNGDVNNPSFTLEDPILADIDLSDRSVPFAVDIDYDGDLDLFIGEGYGGLYFRENTGTAEEPEWNSTTQLLKQLNSWRTAIQVVNIQGDSILEMVANSSSGYFRLYDNISVNPADPAIWHLADNNFQNIDNSGRPAFVDIDNDGDLDLFIQGGKLYFYRNIGTPSDPDLVLEESHFSMLPGFYLMLHFGETDLDGKIEMFVPTQDGKIVVYENEGTPSEPNWVFQTNDFLGFTSTYSKPLTIGDVNGDGRPDIFVGHFSNPMFDLKMMLFLNTDTGFVYQPVPSLENFGYGARAVPELVDLNGDGLLELVVANSTQNLFLFEATDSTGLNWQEIPQANSPLPVLPSFIKVSFGDLDFDGDLDMVGGSRYFENVGDASTPEFVVRYWNNAVFGAYPTLVDLTDDCGLELFSGLSFYKYRGIKPEIQADSGEICTNEGLQQITALPSNSKWLSGPDSNGIFNPDTLAGYYGIVCSYSAPEGCYTKYDTIWVQVVAAPDASILAVGEIPIMGDTIDVCSNAGIQTLTTAQSGTFYGLNMSNGKFDPGLWGLGFHTVRHHIYQNGCEDGDTLVINIITCTVGVREEHVQGALQLRVSPNPFSNEVTFEMELQEAGTVRLILTDLTGRIIEILVDAPLPAGSHTFSSHKAGSMAVGMYIVRGEMDGQAFSRFFIKQ